MSITLRRKMFKLGGEANTHGIGITSGLEYRRPGYNKGGEVTTPIGVGSGKQPMIPGPDGKLREGHVAPVVAGLGNLLAFGLPKLLSPMARRYGYKGAQQISKALADPKKSAFYKAAIKKGGNKAGIKAIARNEGIQRAGMLDKVLTYGAPALYGAGAATALGERAGVIDPERTNVEKYGSMLSQGALDYLSLPGYGSMAAQAGLQIPGDEDATITNLSDLLSGKTTETEKTVGSANDTAGGLNQKNISPAMETTQTQEEQFAKMKADADQRAEMYYAMLGGDGPNKVRALADAFTNAGALYDEDKSQALAGFSQGIQGELDRDETVRDEARRLGLQEVVGLRDEERMDTKAREQMFEQAELSIVASPDLTPEQRSSALQGLRAYKEGIVDILPTNDKGDEAETERMAAGTVYYDPANLYGGMYVAKPTTPDAEVKSFTTLAEAQAHARS